MAILSTYPSRTLAKVAGVDASGNVGLSVTAGVREVLGANRTYYVRSDGSNSNTGLTDTAGGAFLTFQHAVDVVENNIDWGIYGVTIHLGTGTWPDVVFSAIVGGNYSNLTIDGSGSGSTTTSLYAGYASNVIVQNLSLNQSAGSLGFGLVIGEHAEIIVGSDIKFTSTSGSDIYAYDNGACSINASYSISGNKSSHFTGDFSARFHMLGNHTVTMVGTPVISRFFDLVDNMQVDWQNATSSGTMTGSKWRITGAGAGITGAGIANIPGTTAGTYVANTVSAARIRGNVTQAPRTVTASTDTLGDTDYSIIANFAGTVTLTLPAASSFTNRIIKVKTITANTVISATSNVVPLIGGSAGTAILSGTAGRHAELQSDGTNWVIMGGVT